MNQKPQLSFWQIWNMCFGFLGIQFGFALQNANVSRIFQTLGAEMEQLPGLWMAAPLTGLIVQPIIGYLSDRTWHPLFGRRRPYFLIGAILASIALLFMPNSPTLWIAAGTLWVLDASINVAMEPFRAYVGDQLPVSQRAKGYAMQSFFIGIGSVIASMLPWMLEKWGVANTAAAGEVPDTVRFAFYAGAGVMFGAILWTVLSSREYPPDTLHAYDEAPPLARGVLDLASTTRQGIVWLMAGAIGSGVVYGFGLTYALPKELYLLGGLALAYGLCLLALRSTVREGVAWAIVGAIGLALVYAFRGSHALPIELYGVCAAALGYGLFVLALAAFGRGGFTEVMQDMQEMPPTMRKLAVVQFFSWFALFCMWIYTTPTVAAIYYGSTDPTSEAFNQGGNWVGVLFAAYNGFAALAAVFIPMMARRFGLRRTHLINVAFGGVGLILIPFLPDENWLLLSMAGVGFAWASILSIPYALLSDSVPAQKMGVYMGIFNFFIVIPQLIAVASLGFLLKALFEGQPAGILVLGGASMIFAGLLTMRVHEPR
jgi:maltose/moltooligosaccharide transporter